MILATLACPVFTSCYDDAPLWEKVEDLDARLTALEAKLNTDLAALQTLLEGQINALSGKVDALVTVKDCEEQADGSYVITLSDGTEFTVYPEYKENHTGLVTTTEVNGVLYWAVYDKDGKAVVVTDADGNPVPVVDVVPQVKVDTETAVVSISFDGGKTWIEVGTDTPYIFAGAEVVTTDYYTDEEEAADPEWNTEDPLYVVLTLADGRTITVTIDGAASFMFASNYGGVIKTQYIAAAEKTTVSVMATNIEGWVKDVPAGWMVEENTQYLAEYGQAEFNVTAPTAEAIASGAAVAEGDLKVVAVAVGGKTVTASVKLTTVPFKTVAAGKGGVTVEMNNGLGGYLVGVSTIDAYDADAIVAELKSVVEYYEEYENWQGEMMKEYTWSPWYTKGNATTLDDYYMDGSVEAYPVADLASDLVLGEQYIVWAVALNMWYDNVTYAQGYTVGDIVSTTYLNANITLDETATVVKFNDIQISAEFAGVTEFFGDFSEQYPGYETTADEVVMGINEAFSYGYAPEALLVNDPNVEGWAEGEYTGSPKDLVNGYQEVEPGSKYYFYLIPVVEGKTEYTVNDVYWYEFSTPALVAGGSVKVAAGEATLDYKKVTVPLTAEGAVYIYYKFVETEKLSTIEDKAAYLLEEGAMNKGAASSVSKANLQPSQTITLLAMAVGEDGKYGEVFQQDYTTKAMDYASATVTATLVGTPAQTGTVKISCDAEVTQYYYWYGTKDNSQWTSASNLGGSVESASAFIALSPDSWFLTKVAPADLPTEGIAMEDLTVGAPSVFVIAAKLSDNTFTKATVVEFTPSLDLGNFVYATDDNNAENPAWVAAKPTVTYDVDSIGDFTNVTWSVVVPEGFTAKTACFSEDYLQDYPSAKNKVEFLLTYPYVEVYDVVAGEEYSQPYASKGYNIYTVICDAEGNYYEVYVEKLNISGGFGV